MIKTITTIGFLLLTVAFNANANADDSNRIDQMEMEIQAIKGRLSEIETIIHNPGEGKKHVTPGEGWQSIENWRKLTRGMNPDDVRKILGDPYNIQAGKITHWYYQDGGEVSFYGGAVDLWREPEW